MSELRGCIHDPSHVNKNRGKDNREQGGELSVFLKADCNACEIFFHSHKCVTFYFLTLSFSYIYVVLLTLQGK